MYVIDSNQSLVINPQEFLWFVERVMTSYVSTYVQQDVQVCAGSTEVLSKSA